MNEENFTPKITGDRIKAYLEEGKRFDGRTPDQFREIKIEKDISKKAEGSVRVKLGKSEVLVGVKMKVVEPYADSPDEGVLMTTADLLPISSERFESGPPKFPAIELGRVIDRGLRESGFIDFKKLCIKEGEKVWNIFVDIYSLNEDGNLLDAGMLGAIIALKSARIPHYDIEEDKIDYEKEATEKIPLSEPPISITVHKLGDNFLVDPTREEEDVSDARITFGISGEIISSVQKGESGSIDLEKMKEAIDLAEKVSKNVRKEIEKYLD
ncbi:RNA-binding protein [Candidatus Pacearchaeota archaeon ex4484_71]|nr:MAG: RNA-binding protein [Candidatus Pacearchaeota archaeon ex4484_71]